MNEPDFREPGTDTVQDEQTSGGTDTAGTDTQEVSAPEAERETSDGE